MNARELVALVARYLPEQAGAPVSRLGAGLDNVAFTVGDLVVRVSKADDAAAVVTREAALLDMVAEVSTLDVPRPVFVDAEAGVMAYRRIVGEPLLGRRVGDPARLGTVLGDFVAALMALPAERVSTVVERDEPDMAGLREEAEEAYQTLAPTLPARRRRDVERFLASAVPPPPPRLVFCHNDLSAEHVLATGGGTVTGVIDWTDAALADLAYDVGLLFRDFGPDTLTAVTARLGEAWDDADTTRALFHARCALLEDLAYGLRTGDARYADATRVVHTFG